jgi:hypothetical protein
MAIKTGGHDIQGRIPQLPYIIFNQFLVPEPRRSSTTLSSSVDNIQSYPKGWCLVEQFSDRKTQWGDPEFADSQWWRQ